MNYFQLLVNAILAKYFKHFDCVFFISDGADYFFRLNESLKLVVYETNKLNEINLELACQGFVVHSTRILETLVYLEGQVVKDEAGSFYDRRYLLISPDGNGWDIFGQPFLENVRDVLLVTTENQRLFELWTHKFVSKDYREPLLLDTWISDNEGFTKNVNLYPDKTSNLEGKITRLSTFSYIPYVFVGESFEKSNGIEISLLTEFARRKNLTIVMKDVKDEEWGQYYKNGTGVGVIGDIKTFRSDLACSALLPYQAITTRMDFTFPMIRIRIKVLVPKPKVVINWMTPFTQFSLEVWCLLGIFLMFSSLLLLLLTHLEGKPSVSTNSKTTFAGALFSMTRAILSQGSVAEDHFQRFKGMFIYIFLLAMIITTSYNSTLASRMVVPRYEGVIDTIKDLARSGLEWGGRNKVAWTESFAGDERKEYQKILKSFVEKKEPEILRLGHAGLFGFPIDRLPSGHFAIQYEMDEATLEKLRPMQQDIFSGLSVFLTRKNYALMTPLNEYLLRVAQSGLLHPWELAGVMFYRYRLQNLLSYSDEKYTNIALNGNHVKGIFGLWLIGVVASILVFFYEVCKINQMKRNHIK